MSVSRGPSQPSTFWDLLLLALFLGSNMRYCGTVTIYTATFSTKKMVFFERETKFFQQYVDLKKKLSRLILCMKSVLRKFMQVDKHCSNMFITNRVVRTVTNFSLLQILTH